MILNTGKQWGREKIKKIIYIYIYIYIFLLLLLLLLLFSGQIRRYCFVVVIFTN